MKTRIIAFVNQKGGVAKTTTCMNVGAGLANAGRKVLLVDLDPQASLSISMGAIQIKESEPTLYEVLKGKADINDAITVNDAPKPYCLLATDIRLSGAEIELVNEPGRDMILKNALDEIDPERGKFDYILMDCPPSLNILTIMGLAACTEVIIPIQTQYLALNGMAQLIDTIQTIRKRINPEIVIGGVVATFYDERKLLDQEVLKAVEEAFPDTVFNTKISNNVALAEAPSHNQDIFQYKPSSKGAKQYKALVNEIMAKEGRKA